MRTWIVVLLVTVTVLSVGCVSVNGSGHPATEKRELGAFDEIEIAGAAQVLVGISDEPSCEVKGDDNIVPILKTEVRGTKLRIFSEQSYRPKIPVEILLMVPDLRAVDISGSGKVVLHGVKRKAFSAEISGSGNVVLTGVAVDDFKTDISGSGSITARGTTTVLKSDISGSGSGNFTYLCARDSSVSISGSGSTSLVAMKTLDVRVSGSGAVHYAGKPRITQSISGSGKINPIPTETACPPVD